ncbi:uncharacterized protein PgNI_01271 [Pyricularia grisea]|uniref:Uncharacterized protein n=1 Tax=Pyricularia grisea TaxID=148305 RepID=A0A6P8BIG7_PYRGI|nr:uncharacterized protein PgNI_01271 [Pyricularia grisea]TLD16505.1 hypothetical protein PgNI_01271 [Pyricularia grisea]
MHMNASERNAVPVATSGEKKQNAEDGLVCDGNGSTRPLVKDSADVFDRFLSRLARLTRIGCETRGRARSPLRRRCHDGSRQHHHGSVNNRQYRSPTPSPASCRMMSSIRGGCVDCQVGSYSPNALQPQRRRRQPENESPRLRQGADDSQIYRELQRAFEQLNIEMGQAQTTMKPDDMRRLQLRIDAMLDLLTSRGAAESRPTIRRMAGELAESGPGGARGDQENRPTSIQWADRAT